MLRKSIVTFASCSDTVRTYASFNSRDKAAHKRSPEQRWFKKASSDPVTSLTNIITDIQDASYRRLCSRCRSYTDSDPEMDVAVLIGHCVSGATPAAQITALASAFLVQSTDNDNLFVTCAHSFQQVVHRYKNHLENPCASGSFIITDSTIKEMTSCYGPVREIPSALPRSDLLLVRNTGAIAFREPLNVSPWPAQVGTKVKALLMSDEEKLWDANDMQDGWREFVGRTSRKWARGTVLGYKDSAGREAMPGSYDDLVHMFVSFLPTPGSSDGPIIDEETGAVVGVMLGTHMDNHVEGLRGWAVPVEKILEMFQLPGLELTGLKV